MSLYCSHVDHTIPDSLINEDSKIYYIVGYYVGTSFRVTGKFIDYKKALQNLDQENKINNRTMYILKLYSTLKIIHYESIHNSI